MLLALDVSCWLKIMSKVQWIVCNINGVWSHKTFHDKRYDHLALVHPASNHKTGHPLYVYCMISVGSKFRIPEINHVQFDIWLTIMSCRTPSHWYSCPYIAITLFYQLACFLHWSLLVSIHSSCSANDLEFLPCLCLFILNGAFVREIISKAIPFRLLSAFSSHFQLTECLIHSYLNYYSTL